MSDKRTGSLTGKDAGQPNASPLVLSRNYTHHTISKVYNKYVLCTYIFFSERS